MSVLSLRAVSPAVAAAPAPATLTIDLGAIARNYRLLAKAVAPAECAAVVKADAYGLGVERVVPALLAAGARRFYVATLEEALVVKTLLPADAYLAVLGGVVPGAEWQFRAHGIIPVLNSLVEARRWADSLPRGAALVPTILQADTGMSRLGMSLDDLHTLAADRALLGRLNPRWLMSHLACADEPDHPANQAQREVFQAALKILPQLGGSFANSAGIALGKAFHFDLCRPGAALYGLNTGPLTLPLEPVVGLSARVLQVRTITAETSVGYGYSFTASGPMRLATIGVGYADGLPRSLSGRGAAFLGGHRLPIVGRISMDTCSVDVSALPEDAIALGDSVELIGPQQSADDVAALAGTIGYEILTGLGTRPGRVYVS